MFLELIATFVAGIAAAGLVMLINKPIGGRLPRWAMPACAGAAMIGFTIWNEYNWFNHTTSTLPERFEVVSTVEKTAVYRPWTYLAPYVDRFAAVDHESVKRNPELPDHRIVTVVFMGRWSPVRSVQMMFDCAGNKRFDMVDAFELQPDGLPSANAGWVQMEADNPLLTGACQKA